MIVFFNGNWMEKSEVHISPDDRGYQFADGLYEVIHVYEGKLFLPERHIERLENGAVLLRYNRTDFRDLISCSTQLIERNHLSASDGAMYIQVTRGVAERSHQFPPHDTPLSIYMSLKPVRKTSSINQHGLKALLVPDQRWACCYIKTIGLLPNTLAFQQAIDSGADEAIFIRDGFVMEGSHTNVFCVGQHTVMTAPLSNYILPGITRAVVIELCERYNIPVIQRPVSAQELFSMDEVFVVGTMTEVAPVIQINEQMISKGQIGPITQRIQTLFNRFIRDYMDRSSNFANQEDFQ